MGESVVHVLWQYDPIRYTFMGEINNLLKGGGGDLKSLVHLREQALFEGVDRYDFKALLRLV